MPGSRAAKRHSFPATLWRAHMYGCKFSHLLNGGATHKLAVFLGQYTRSTYQIWSKSVFSFPPPRSFSINCP